MEGYEFTIANDQVTAMEWVNGSRTFSLSIPDNATFAVGSGIVTETLTGKTSTAVIQFTQDTSNTSLYDPTSETLTVNTPATTNGNGGSFGYAFTIANGTVTAVQEESSNGTHSYSHNLAIPPTASFTVSGNTVSETLVDGNAVETIQFLQPTGSSLYAVASDTTTLIQPGGASTLLSVNPYDRAEFTISGSGAVTAVQSVSPTGTIATVTPNSHTSFTQLATGFVEETVTYGSHTAYTVFYEGGSGGIYTEVAHGCRSTVDLVGLQAQLAHLPTSLIALV